ncbi:hypothetical protein K2173_021243 [Erythroxylum novogranatense]|uniref:ENTH domain-containing protein n=1 Tax=Erythroxylum novogranatense TaxID=1862640 RepID=A0AAV8TR36_9ROSI|nr:hypothetical protein K2173_021243 [Erythroxylum novogranatense]
MAPSTFKRAIGAVKDQTSIGLAKVNNSDSLSDLEVAIVKATRHEEYPADEKHIREILSLTSYSRAYVSACVSFISRRLNKTKNWTVALKTLMLVQRLLADGDPAYGEEIFFATRRGTRLLNLSDFRDTSRSDSWDFSAFVRTYALYLDERLEFRMQSRRGKRCVLGFEDDRRSVVEGRGGRGQTSNHGKTKPTTPVHEMRTELVFSRMQHLLQLLERFLSCRPTGGAKYNRVVIVALYPIVKESFQLNYDISQILGVLVDRFMELQIAESVKVYEIFCRVSKQLDELDDFYGWCKTVGVARSSEYPEVEKITQKKLDVMDDFLREKTSLAQNYKATTIVEPESETAEVQEPEVIEEDMYEMKALPPPEDFFQEEEKEEPKQEEQNKGGPREADLLNLGGEDISTEDQSNRLALALFDGGVPVGPNGPPAWEAFKDEGDWETALVQTASHLSNQKTNLPGGFDMLLLDGMYQQGTMMHAMSSSVYAASGSASSVALGSAGRPAMLALPAPPTTKDGDATTTGNGDPFAASVGIAPPPYVQISDLEKKHKLLMEEQLMWQQYARDGMQRQVGFAKILQQNPYHMGGGYRQGYY